VDIRWDLLRFLERSQPTILLPTKYAFSRFRFSS